MLVHAWFASNVCDFQCCMILVRYCLFVSEGHAADLKFDAFIRVRDSVTIVAASISSTPPAQASVLLAPPLPSTGGGSPFLAHAFALLHTVPPPPCPSFFSYSLSFEFSSLVAHKHIRAQSRLSLHGCTYTHTETQRSVRAYTHTRTHARTHTHTHTHMKTHTNTCARAHTRTRS